MGSVFANGPGDRDSISGWSHTNESKMVLDAALLNSQHYKVWIKGKRNNPGKGVGMSPTPQCSNYCKKRLWVTLDNSQTTYIYIYIYIYICLCVCVCVCVCTFLRIYLTPLPRARRNIRSYLKRSLISEFSFSYTGCHTKVKEHCQLYYLPITGGRMDAYLS